MDHPVHPSLPLAYPGVHSYVAISVQIVRPAMSFCGPRFSILHAPPQPLILGLRVLLEVRYLDHSGNAIHAVEAGIRGPIFAIESLSTDHIEFAIRNEEPTGHLFAYILVPGFRHGFVHMPLEFYDAWTYLRPFLACTMWPHRLAVDVHVDVATCTHVLPQASSGPVTSSYTASPTVDEWHGRATPESYEETQESQPIETSAEASVGGCSQLTHVRRLSAFWDLRLASVDGNFSDSTSNEERHGRAQVGGCEQEGEMTIPE